MYRLARKKAITWLCLVGMINMTYLSCVYESSEAPKDNFVLLDPSKITLLHGTDRTYILKNTRIDNLHLEALPVEANPTWLEANSKNGQVVHLRTNAVLSDYLLESGRISFPINMVLKVEVIDLNLGKTIFYSTLGVAGAVGLLFLIFLLTKDSCPFIYAYDGENYVFTGEIYSGSIYPAMERHDYLPLPVLAETSGEYRIKMTNEVHEIQNTNLTELMVIEHAPNTSVLADKYGNLHTITQERLPVKATSLNGSSISEIIKARDNFVYLNEDPYNTEHAMEGMTLSFVRPPDQQAGKLIIHAKNSMWLDYLHGQLSEEIGDRYPAWREKQAQLSRSEHEQTSLDNGVPLSVHLKMDSKWQFVDYFNVVGPLAAKDDILSIDLSEVMGDTVEIKLDYGFLFWEVDYVSMDFTRDETVEVHTLPVTSAHTNLELDVAPLLAKDDDQYYIQTEVGDVAFLTFEAPDLNPNLTQTYILHSKGHYEILRNPSGDPDLAHLYKYRKADGFIQYSRDNFKKLMGGIDPSGTQD